MARSHGQLLASIWSDADWLALTGGAQRLYMLLLSQQKLTLVGLLDYLPSRWARLAADTTLDSIEDNVAELEASRFVIVDRDTDELLIRTLVKHDITTVLSNKNLLRGLWNAWDAIASRQLRVEVVRNIPASVWESPRCQPHPEALEIRRSLQSEPPVQTHGSDDRSSPLSTLHLPPSNAVADLKQPGNSRGDGPSEAAAVDNSGRLSDERQLRIDAAIELLVARELERNPSRQNPRRHASAVRRGKHRDYHQLGHQALATDPNLTAERLANLLEPPANGHVPAVRSVAAVSPGPSEAETAQRLAAQRGERIDSDRNVSNVRALRESYRLPTAATPGDGTA